jgi:hypothetical protein
MGVNEYDFNVALHIGYKSYEREDLDIYDLLSKIYYATERFQYGPFARLNKLDETWDTDYNNIQIIQTTYRGYGKDYERYVLNDKPSTTITGLTITSEIVYSGITCSGMTGEGDNGNNEYNGELPDTNKECE